MSECNVLKAGKELVYFDLSHHNVKLSLTKSFWPANVLRVKFNVGNNLYIQEVKSRQYRGIF